MPIKNKDGSIYTLQTPNPILINQDNWDKTKIQLLNMTWKPITTPQPSEQPPEVADISSLPPQIQTTSFHCLPAIKVKKYDELYDTESYKISFGSKFTFIGVIIAETDLEISFWTESILTEGSIVYPIKSMRCWKINEVKHDRYIAYPSDFSPSWD